MIETGTLRGDHLSRALDALRIARHHARIAQGAADGRHLQEALAELDEAVDDHLARIRNAVEDDAAEAEENGEADRRRRACFPAYSAA